MLLDSEAEAAWTIAYREDEAPGPAGDDVALCLQYLLIVCQHWSMPFWPST
jgi:hypothetical protein